MSDDRVNALITALATANIRRDAAQSTVAEARRRVRKAFEGTDERWRKLVDPSVPQSLFAAKDRLAEDKAKVTLALEGQKAAEEEVADLERRQQALARERTQSVETPLAVATSALTSLVELVNDLAARSGVPAAAPPTVGRSPKELVKVAGEARATAESAIGAARARVEELQQQIAGLIEPAGELVTALVALMDEADSGGLEVARRPDAEDPLGTATRDVVQQIVGAARKAASDARSAATKAKEDVKTARDLDKRIRGLRSWKTDLDGAIEVLKKDNFPTWARNLRTADLVDTSSELLSEMTGGRFRFDPGLRIADQVAGVSRPASTLSGGEKFEASLSLALGVAEIAGRSGIRFDTLFLDEGFAGLDQAHLNRALDALETEVAAGRCIVLITHIGSVADRIQDVLLIEPDGYGGSNARWLNEEERFELGADLDLAVS